MMKIEENFKTYFCIIICWIMSMMWFDITWIFTAIIIQYIILKKKNILIMSMKI